MDSIPSLDISHYSFVIPHSLVIIHYSFLRFVIYENVVSNGASSHKHDVNAAMI